MSDPKINESVVTASAAAGRTQPHADGVERSVLSAMLRDPVNCMGLAAEIFGPQAEIFYSATHREIYAVLKELHAADKNSVDVVSVAQRLRERGKLDAVGGEEFLVELEMAAPNAVNFESWCQVLQKYAMLRRMISVCSGALIKCYDPEADAGELVSAIETDIFNVRDQETRPTARLIAPIMTDVFQELQRVWKGETEVGIPTGFAKLDEFTGGLKPGEMFVLAARPSIGKTALALNVIRNVTIHCPKPRKVAFFSLEMTAEQIGLRLLCTETGIPEGVFRNKGFNQSDLVKLTKAIAKIQKAQLFIDPTGGLSIAEFRAKAMRLKKQYDIDLIVVDYLQLMHDESRAKDGRQNEVAGISGGIKKLAKDLKIPILVLAQLNREVDKAAGNVPVRPKLAHLRESGTIEQDADIVTFLHRDREETKNIADGVSVEAEWIVEKNRNGRIGSVKLLFYPSRMEFVPAAPCSEEFAPETKVGN